MVRSAVFHDATSARDAIAAARASGFTRIHAITGDPEILAELQAEIGRDSRLLARSPGMIALNFGAGGAAVGLLVGFVGAWFLSTAGVQAGIANLVLPIAGAIFGGFVGAMVSRGFTFDAESFYGQELGSGEIVVAIEVGSPARLASAEKILGGDHRAPHMLPRV
jgi:hypothetical protein